MKVFQRKKIVQISLHLTFIPFVYASVPEQQNILIKNSHVLDVTGKPWAPGEEHGWQRKKTGNGRSHNGFAL